MVKEGSRYVGQVILHFRLRVFTYPAYFWTVTFFLLRVDLLIVPFNPEKG
jgi:hypothetical protein